jgi:diacylglycerol kinase family enzyme
MTIQTDWPAAAMPAGRVTTRIGGTRRVGPTSIQIVATTGSGNGVALDAARRLGDALRARGYRVALEAFTDVPSLRHWAARGGAGSSLVIGVGGDGTQSTTAAAAVRHAIPFLAVPSGFGNLFARALGYVPDVDRVVELVDHGTVVHVDVGVRNGQVFLDQESFGLVAEIQAHVEGPRRSPRARWRRWLAYYRGALRYLRDAPLSVFEVTVDGRLVTRAAAVVTVANVATYGPWLPLTPEASPVDGFLDVFAMGATSKGALLAKLLRRHLRLPAADPKGLLCRGRRVSVTASPTLRAEIGLLPGRLPVLVSVETARRLHRHGRLRDALAGRGGPRAA